MQKCTCVKPEWFATWARNKVTGDEYVVGAVCMGCGTEREATAEEVSAVYELTGVVHDQAN
jgi:hypothetical protein